MSDGGKYVALSLFICYNGTIAMPLYKQGYLGVIIEYGDIINFDQS